MKEKSVKNSKSNSIAAPLTRNQKIIYIIIFFAGMICSYPTLFPIGMALTCILLFKKDNIKINLIGLFLIIYQLGIIGTFTALVVDMLAVSA